ncbi:hypothetical protein LWI29_037403 [Acer saccharum]|uniref:RNase H type-1 domain-containing protein n=1 Tax=Acer saccharum TaxID=4024 RepID=A0AA39S5M1_ACESA|nr:hypothetical protein LWI29_037403 [Acer saccharum]
MIRNNEGIVVCAVALFYSGLVSVEVVEAKAIYEGILMAMNMGLSHLFVEYDTLHSAEGEKLTCTRCNTQHVLSVAPQPIKIGHVIQFSHPTHPTQPPAQQLIQPSQPTQLRSKIGGRCSDDGDGTPDVQRRRRCRRRTCMDDGGHEEPPRVSAVLLRSYHHHNLQLLGGSSRRRRRCSSDDGDGKSRREAGGCGGGKSGGGRLKPSVALRVRRRPCTSGVDIAVVAARPASRRRRHCTCRRSWISTELVG